MAAVIAWARPSFAPHVLRLGAIRSAMLVMRLMTAFIGLHVLEILLWAGFYRWLCFPLWESSFYFSTSSYATVGYGDVVLPQAWRTLGPVESIIGVLMCGLSASFLFAIVSRLVDREARFPGKLAHSLTDFESMSTNSNLSGRKREDRQM